MLASHFRQFHPDIILSAGLFADIPLTKESILPLEQMDYTQQKGFRYRIQWPPQILAPMVNMKKVDTNEHHNCYSFDIEFKTVTKINHLIEIRSRTRLTNSHPGGPQCLLVFAVFLY